MNNLDADALIKAGRRLQVPFVLTVMRDDVPVDMVIQDILRLLPARRIVAVAEQDGIKYLVKIFVGRFSDRYARRETRGVGLIESADVLTPSLRWQGRLRSGGSVLAFEYIEDAQSLLDGWQNADDDDQRLALMADAMKVLARLHDAGIVQHDIHPENFLIKSGQLYTIDGGGVRQKRRLSSGASLDNLALFFAQFQAKDDVLIPAAMKHYLAARAWDDASGWVEEDLVADVLVSVDRHRAERKSDYIAKAFRECTRFACTKSFKRFTVIERDYDSPALAELLRDLDSAMASGKMLKDGNTATVVLLENQGHPLVVKRYNLKSTWHRLSRMFRKSRAWVSWANAMRLEFLGINTVKPVALLEERLGPLRGRAYFISEYVEGPDASQITVESEQQLDSIAQLIRNLADAGVSHGDLKATNVLLADDGPVIIDLDSMREMGKGAKRTRAEQEDRERFMKNWERDPKLEQRFDELL